VSTTRTRREFEAGEPIWPRVDAWARDARFRMKESAGDTRTYQRGHGFWTAPMMVEVGQTGDRAHVEAWIRAGMFARASSLFILPREMGIASGGFKGKVPRNVARRAVNELLASLQQPPIP
jgi:hypothetical protein